MAGLTTERQRIQHLLRRAAFGYSSAELEEYLALGLDGTIERLLAPELVDDTTAEVALAEQEFDFKNTIDVIRAWNLRIQHTKRPLVERMTVFWHGHFACSVKKARRGLMHLQNQTLRAHAMGSFPELTLAVTRDPAMMYELDNRMNTVDRPNENYARELMELFTMGEGQGYTEIDVQEAARALTGWRFSQESIKPNRHGVSIPKAQQEQLGKLLTTNLGNSELQVELFEFEQNMVQMVPRLHDDGEKTLLNVTGPLADEDVVAIVTARSETAEFIAGKLWRHFAGEEPEPKAVERIVTTYHESGGNVRAMLRGIFTAPEFYSERAYRSRVKSPVELIFGTLRALEISTSGREEISHAKSMNQLLYDPPHPQGWLEGESWLNSTTMLARSNFANEVTRQPRNQSKSGLWPRRADLGALLQRAGADSSAEDAVEWTLDLLVGGDVDAETRGVLVEHLGGPHHFDFDAVSADGRLPGMLYLALSMPLYQVA